MGHVVPHHYRVDYMMPILFKNQQDERPQIKSSQIERSQIGRS